MPNHIQNRLTINGSFEDVDNIVNKYGTYIKARLSLTYDGDDIVCEDLNGHFWGWYNIKNCFYHTRGDKQQYKNCPEGVKFIIKDSFFHFPDFQKIRPMPKVIENTKGNAGVYPPWYTWSCDNWGTKWNSYECTRTACNIFEFETAWSNVADLLADMTKDNKIEIFYEWSDEDTGYNCGYAFLKNGKAKVYNIEGGTNEAYEHAFKLRPYLKEQFVFIDGKWKYKEDEV